MLLKKLVSEHIRVLKITKKVKYKGANKKTKKKYNILFLFLKKKEKEKSLTI
jgi:hypothetical protein